MLRTCDLCSAVQQALAMNGHGVSQDDRIDQPTSSWQIQRPSNTGQPTAARSS